MSRPLRRSPVPTASGASWSGTVRTCRYDRVRKPICRLSKLEPGTYLLGSPQAGPSQRDLDQLFRSKCRAGEPGSRRGSGWSWTLTRPRSRSAVVWLKNGGERSRTAPRSRKRREGSVMTATWRCTQHHRQDHRRHGCARVRVAAFASSRVRCLLMWSLLVVMKPARRGGPTRFSRIELDG